MSRFFVGQRVRIVRLVETTEFEGVETRIFRSHPKGWWVLDGLGWCSEGNLEPILPSGHQPSEYTFQGLMNDLRSGVAA